MSDSRDVRNARSRKTGKLSGSSRNMRKEKKIRSRYGRGPRLRNLWYVMKVIRTSTRIVKCINLAGPAVLAK
jgi:hypothetical protein